MPRHADLKKLVLGLFVFVAMSLGASLTAKADAYLINTSNFAGNQNFGSITTTLVGNTIQVDVVLTPGWVLHNAGVGFNIGGTGVSSTAISPSAFFSLGGSGNFDGYGNFAYSVAGTNTGAARANNLTSVTFTVSRTGGFTAADLGLFTFAVQIAPLVDNGATGFAITGPPTTTAVPEPASMLLLGTGLLGFGAAIRRRRKATK